MNISYDEFIDLVPLNSFGSTGAGAGYVIQAPEAHVPKNS
jgi:hypothetical protein